MPKYACLASLLLFATSLHFASGLKADNDVPTASTSDAQPTSQTEEQTTDKGGDSTADENGFTDLFDGKTLKGWTDANGKPIKKGWVVQDGLLVRESRGGNIYPPGSYGDFELRFEWRISEKGNSGIKYRVAFYKKGVFGRPGWIGAEYQIYDDTKKVGLHTTGSIYGLLAPNDRKQVKPLDEFNTSRIIVRDGKIEHWLNGEKIVEAEMNSDLWQERIRGSKFGKIEGFLQNKTGRIHLQDHGKKVWFRKIQIREFPANGVAKSNGK